MSRMKSCPGSRGAVSMLGGFAFGMGATLNLSAAYLPNPRTLAKPRLGSGGKRLAIR
jgi:hypothetical protein